MGADLRVTSINNLIEQGVTLEDLKNGFHRGMLFEGDYKFIFLGMEAEDLQKYCVQKFNRCGYISFFLTKEIIEFIRDNIVFDEEERIFYFQKVIDEMDLTDKVYYISFV